MTPSTIIATAAEMMFLATALFAARTAYRTIALGDRTELGRAIFWSITKTVWVLGPLLFIGVMWLFLSDAPARDTGGIMSREMGVGVLAVGTCLALALFWASAIGLGFVAANIVRNLAPRAAFAVVLGIVALSPLLCMTRFVALQQQARVGP